MFVRHAIWAALCVLYVAACGESTQDMDPGKAVVLNGNGSGAVGLWIVPGIYRTDGPANVGEECTYRRIGFGKDDSRSVLQEGSTPSGPVVIEIKGTDSEFASSGCLDWIPLRLDPDAPTTIYDGRHEVGVDVQPGWYRTAGVRRGQSWCSYLSYDGKTSQQLKSTKKAASVFVEPTHATFISTNCQPWVPQEREP